MKPREYCCCAVPLVNAGIYITLLEQFTLGILAGTLAVATPAIVGAATPSFAKWIFAIICYVGAAVQIFGFLGVLRERPILFRRYTTLHILLTVAAFSVAAVWIVISGVRHNTANANCQSRFFSTGNTSEGSTLCNIFAWVDIGLMSGLWVFLALVQLYLYVVVSSYGTGQQLDHEKYDSMYDPTKPLTSDIPLNDRSDPWTSRPSEDGLMQNRGYHTRENSVASVSTVMADRRQDEHGGGYQDSYPPNEPGNAYTQDPGPTPYYNNYYAADHSGNVSVPDAAQPHPGTSHPN